METPPNARQVQDAEQAARDVRRQTSTEDFRRLVAAFRRVIATAEETAPSARETPPSARETPPTAFQVTYDAELAARAGRWQTSIEDFRRLVAMAEETAVSACKTARAAEAARLRVISTCYLGEFNVAYVTEAHLSYLSGAAALADQNAQDTAIAAQQAYDMVSAACARQTHSYTPHADAQ